MNRRGFLKGLVGAVVAAAAAPVISKLDAAAWETVAVEPTVAGGYPVPDEFLEQLVKGIKRQSPLILDNLGIKVSSEWIQSMS